VRHDAGAAGGPVLVLQDNSCIGLTMNNAITGWIGNDGDLGFVAHWCLAVAPGSLGHTILGLADKTVWTRTEPPCLNQESRAMCRRRRPEADVWAQRVEAIGWCPAHALCLSVGDRAADVFSHFGRTRAIGWHCLVRVCQDRRTDTGHSLETLRGLPVIRGPVADASDTVVLLARALKVDPAAVATSRNFYRDIARLGGLPHLEE
jgi:hypothetical protein